MKKIASIFLFLGFLSLLACSKHNNPLMAMSRQHATSLLLKANQYAEKQMHLSYGGYAYSFCMDDRIAKPVCRSLYQSMLAYMQKANVSGVSSSDLSDQHMWRTVRDTYEAMVFNQ